MVGVPNSDCIFFNFYGLSEERDWCEHLYAWNMKQVIRFSNVTAAGGKSRRILKWNS